MEKLLTVGQLREQLQVDRMTIYRMLNSGRLKGVKVGGQWRFRDEDIRHLLADAPAGGAALPAGETSLPIPCLQAMQQLFSEAAEVAAVAIDPNGNALTEVTNGCEFCAMIRSTETGSRLCSQSWARLADGQDSHPRLHRCHAGLLYARTTIYVDGKPLAAVVAGQAVSDSEYAAGPTEALASVAAACALPLPRLQAAFATVHHLDQRQMDKALHLLRILGVAACRIGSERQRLVSKLDRIAEISTEK